MFGIIFSRYKSIGHKHSPIVAKSKAPRKKANSKEYSSPL